MLFVVRLSEQMSFEVLFEMLFKCSVQSCRIYCQRIVAFTLHTLLWPLLNLRYSWYIFLHKKLLLIEHHEQLVLSVACKR